MKFVVLFEDHPAAGPDVRRRHMPEHLAFLERHASKVQASGPLKSADSQDAGGLWLEVDGIGKTRLSRITAGWSEQKVIREIMVFLQSHGVGTARSVRIFRTYGADAVPIAAVRR
jgi:hypothetical protein